MTRKPLIQRVALFLIAFVGGILFLGQVLDGFSNAMALITLPISLIFTFIVIIVYFILLLILKKRGIKWLSRDGQLLNIRKLSVDMLFPTLGVLFLLWTPVFVRFIKPSQPTLANTKVKSNAIETPKPIFDLSDKRFKILVLPFDKECEFQRKELDIGDAICRRLEILNNEDSLNLVTHFFTDSLDLDNINPSSADAIMKFNNANQIVYGFYSLKECEANTSDKVCFNYRTDSVALQVLQSQPEMNYDMIDIEGLPDIRNGTGQEKIDYIIYSLAATSAIGSRNMTRAIKLFKKIKDYDDDEFVGITIAYCYVRLHNLQEAMRILNNVTIKHPTSSFAWNNLGLLYAKSRNKSQSKRCYQIATKLNSANAIAWNNLGNYYYSIKDYNKAIECYRTAATQSSGNYIFWSNLAHVLYIHKKDYGQAKIAYDSILTIRPNDTAALWGLALSYGHIQNLPKAIEKMQHYLKFGRQRASAFTNLSTYYLGLDDYANASKYAFEALSIDSTKAIALSNLSAINMMAGTTENMLIYAYDALNIDPTNAQALNVLGVFLCASVITGKRKIIFKKLSKRAPITQRLKGI